MSNSTLPALTLHRGFPARACYVWSPFSNKLEARLRMAGLRYKLGAGSPMKAPRGKIPYVEAATTQDAESKPKQQLLGDSGLIVRKFVEDGHMADLNASLTPAERAKDLAVRALLEDKLYFYQVRERWQDNYYTMRDTVLAAVPYPVRVLVGLLAYRKVMGTLHGQGVLRYTREEAAAARREVWEGLNAMLVEARSRALAAGRQGPFWVLGGEKATEADSVVFGFVAASLVCKAAPESEKLVRSFPVLVEYATRIHDKYFSDYERWEE
ncbi:hypothetical protein N0V88_002136 [Collariella sp. IMI 366227]|nr:hypothetical protein N0V88_002136 [Collariella sp. IMI 366227]